MRFQILPLDETFDRSAFDCGVHELNDFLKTKARQNQDKGINRSFVATQTEDSAKTVLGFYCISSGQVNLEILPEAHRIRLPRHPVPVALVGRLAVALSARGQGLGELLLVDCLKRIKLLSLQIGIFAVVVDSKDAYSTSFYQKYGFIPFEIDGKKLFLPLESIP